MFPAEPIPDTIGAYKIIRRIESLYATGPAEVYLARNVGPLGFERECELKVMPDTSDGNREFAEELAREAAICARLNHPAVVKVYDFFEHDGKLVLVLERVEGITLAELMAYLPDARQKLAEVGIFYIGARIAGAIAEAHAATDEKGNPTPIIHRNLSPESVLIGTDGEVRLSGFGLGKILGRTPDTAIGRIKGTPGFMAPEQARGEPVTTKADVYGLGLLLWSLLAWRRPPTDGTWPRRISNIRNDLPKEVSALVDSALDHFPGTRKITARELEQWLSRAASPAKGKAELRDKFALLRKDQSSHEPEPESPPPPSSRRRITTGSPYQGVRFGAPASGAATKPGAPPAATKAAGEARKEPSRTPTLIGHDGGSGANPAGGTRVLLNLPPPPPLDEAGPPSPAREKATPPPAQVRFGRPPEPTPAPISNKPATEGPTLPSRGIVPPEAVPVSDGAPAAPPPLAAPPPPMVTPAPPIAIPAPVVATPAPAVATPAPPVASPAPPPAITPSPAPVTAAPSPAYAPPPVAAFALPPPEPRRGPLPSLLVAKDGRRSLSAMGTVVVSAITATVVVAMALYFFVFRDKTSSTSEGPGKTAGTSSAQAAPQPPLAVTAPPTATASAAPAASSAPSANPADLPFGFGYLTVVSPANANVYVSGKMAGPVNQPLKVRCGRWFVRLAVPTESGKYPEWVSAGETVVVACQESTRIELGPKRP
jgi:serine/threonine-protein kinase